jgi:hypothetical protein
MWLKVLIGLGVALILFCLIALAPLGRLICDLFTKSAVSVSNMSGSDVRFEKVTVNNQTIWDRSEVIIKTYSNPENPYLDMRGGSIYAEFRAPRRKIELKLIVINEMNEKEVLSCTLDNSRRPCHFSADYRKGKLVCGDCVDYLD